MKDKVCTKCKIEKPVSEFYSDKRTKSGLYSGCKKCHNLKYYRDYQIKNRKQITLNHRNRRRTDIQFRLTCLLRSRLRYAIKDNSKRGSAVRDLGCTISELKFYLEGKFQDGMTWDNHSFTGWHLDHIIPLSFFDLTDREQLLQAVHYTNLQPMWAKENLQKGKSIKIEIPTL